MRWFAVMVLVGCESAAPPSPPTPIVPTPPVDAPPPSPPIDAAPAVVDLDCFVNGPKEYQRVKTDHATMKGLLERITAGPVPDRAIRYVARAAGPATFELVFAGYEPGDYHRRPPYKPTSPREKLEVGKSVIARLFLQGSQTFLRGELVDLHTGMQIQAPDNAYPCGSR